MSRLYRLVQCVVGLVFGSKPKETPLPEEWVSIGKRPMPGKTWPEYEARRNTQTGRIQYYIPEGNCWM